MKRYTLALALALALILSIVAFVSVVFASGGTFNPDTGTLDEILVGESHTNTGTNAVFLYDGSPSGVNCTGSIQYTGSWNGNMVGGESLSDMTFSGVAAATYCFVADFATGWSATVHVEASTPTPTPSSAPSSPSSCTNVASGSFCLSVDKSVDLVFYSLFLFAIFFLGIIFYFRVWTRPL